jgi:alkylhydroperoxidase family enzyme
MSSFFLRIAVVVLSLVFGAGTTAGWVQEPSAEPKPIPRTRVETKQALEALKRREPRLPLPEPAAEELQRANASGFGLVNNGRMRARYLPADLLPASGARGERGRSGDPHMTLDNAFTVELFWIASRANNCHYCLGHQEVKLRSAGRDENRIAALDCRWTYFSEAEQAAFALARKLTLEPHRITDDDLAALRKHYEPRQVLEIVFHVARYNATNRWTDSLGIPQESSRELLTETIAEFAELPSIVAAFDLPERGPLPTRAVSIAALDACRSRTPRMTLVDEGQSQELLAAEKLATPAPQWVRLLAHFPVAGKLAVEQQLRLEKNGSFPAELKAEIRWVCARHDRAWYALGTAAHRLAELGYTQDQMFALDNPLTLDDPRHRAALALAAKLTATPQAITDADIAGVREYFSDAEVAELVYRITQAAFFNRLTEAAGLALEY